MTSIIYRFYNKSISFVSNYLVQHQWMRTGYGLSAIMTEPSSCIRAIVDRFLGMNQLPINPTSLSERSQKMTSVLLLHGNYHNETAWRSLILSIFAKNPEQPLFTLNMDSGCITEEQVEKVREKIEDICALYKKNARLYLIGHSKGAKLATRAAFCNGEYDPRIEKVVRISSPMHPGEILALEENISHFYEIDSLEDHFRGEGSFQDEDRKLAVSCGHLGALYSQEVIEKVIDLFNSAQR